MEVFESLRTESLEISILRCTPNVLPSQLLKSSVSLILAVYLGFVLTFFAPLVFTYFSIISVYPATSTLTLSKCVLQLMGGGGGGSLGEGAKDGDKRETN